MKKLLIILLSIQMLFALEVKELKKGDIVEDSVQHLEKKYYKVGIKNLKDIHVTLSNLDDDVDLYVRTERIYPSFKEMTLEELVPKIRNNDCYSSNSHTKNEKCRYQVWGPAPGNYEQTVYIMVYGYKAGSYTLKVRELKHKKIDILTTQTIKNRIKKGKTKQYRTFGKAGETVKISLFDLSADADLRVKVGKKANRHTFDCKSIKGGTKVDSCSITLKDDAWVYAQVDGYRTAKYSIKAVQAKINPCITLEDLKAKINNNEDVTKVNTSCITDMHNLITGRFNQDIGNWDVSNVTDMSGMFAQALDFNQNIGNWDVSKVTDMSDMFWSAYRFNQNISKWDVSKVTDMSNMFSMKDEFGDFNQDISKWDVSNVTNMRRMFFQGSAYQPGEHYNFKNHDLSKWNVNKVKYHEDFLNNSHIHKNIEPKWNDGNDTDRCSLEPKVGECRGAFRRYYFDNVSQSCQEYIYGGCGEMVPFKTLDKCQSSCEVH